MQLFDAQGKPVDVPTSEEIDAKVNAAVAQAKTEAETGFKQRESDLQKSVDDAKAAAVKAATDLAEADKGDTNFAALRKAKEDAEAKAAAAEAAKDDIVKQTIAGVTSQFATRTRDSMLDALSKGDKDLRDKLLVHYEKTLATMPATTDAEVASRVEAAYRLSTDAPNKGIMTQVFGSKPTSSGAPAKSANDIDPKVIEAGAAFGLSEAEIVKYTAKAKGNYIQTNDNK